MPAKRALIFTPKMTNLADMAKNVDIIKKAKMTNKAKMAKSG